MNSLQLERIRKSYGETLALNDVDLSVEQGELVALLGPSGCGKTTMLRIISGFLRPDSGSIILADEDITHTPVHRRDIGMVYQNYALWPHMTVSENVSFGLEMRWVRRDERQSAVTEALELVGLGGFESRYPSQLSGGQQQRVALARALVIKPKLLLLDEPLASLDANLRVQLRFYIRGLQQELGVTTVFVTHDQEEALAVADRVVLMRNGVVLEQAGGEELYHYPKSVFAMTFMGEATLVEGSFEGIDKNDGCYVVSTTVGRLHCGSNQMAQEFEVGEAVRVGIRPDDIQLRSGNIDESRGGAVGEIVARIFLGPWARYEVEVGDLKIHVRVAEKESGSRIEPGSKVLVEVADGAPRIIKEI